MKGLENTIRLKKRVIENLERISESDIQEISDFVEFITIRRYKETAPKIKLLLRRDPILKLMGIASVEPFSERIDQELYG